jgi:hypothetical protein
MYICGRFVFHVAIAASAILSAVGAEAAGGDRVNLLRLPSSRIEWTNVPGGGISGLAALTDGDLNTVTAESAAAPTPLDIVYGFDGATVTPEEVRVTLPDKSQTDAGAAGLEILVSTVSAHTGFRSLRTDPLDPGSRQQTFQFPPAAAQWILVRLLPSPGNPKVAAAEIEVFGHEGTPKSPAKRNYYLKRIEALAQDARAAVVKGRTPSEKGELLLQWLHKGLLAGGYESGQTDLSVLLDTGTYNCVSSAAIYNVLALRLGLDVRAIEVPDHAFSVLYDGTSHMDVETTNPLGFNPARDTRAVQHFERMTGFRYIPDAHRDQRREIEEAGLAALIYYNHGVAYTGQGRYHDALVSYFRAMSLDAEFASAVKNALAVLANWSGALVREKKWEEALSVTGAGLALAPGDAALVNNRAVIWNKWVEAAIDAGQREEAIAILKRAAADVPKGGFLAMQSWVYIKPGETLVKAGQWEEALSLADAGLATLDPDPAAELKRWRSNLYLRWFNAEIDARRFEGAAAVVSKGLAASCRNLCGDWEIESLRKLVFSKPARTLNALTGDSANLYRT